MRSKMVKRSSKCISQTMSNKQSMLQEMTVEIWSDNEEPNKDNDESKRMDIERQGSTKESGVKRESTRRIKAD